GGRSRVSGGGIRLAPAAPVQRCSAPIPSAAATAAPPLEPPGVIAGFQGLRVAPVNGLSASAFQPNSGVVVLPTKTAPCSRKRATEGASSVQSCVAETVLEPRSVGQPFE